LRDIASTRRRATPGLHATSSYRIVRASGGGQRGGARALTPLIGREEELDLLSRRSTAGWS